MFQFKQFTIHQDFCAMKVTEIACLQGAWTPIPSSAKTVLDIGSGTGLLSLMLAQRFPDLKIDALEIDENSFNQGIENIEASKYSSQINCFLGDIKTFHFQNKYDYIICNPPFFENQLSSPNQQKNKAWHSSELTLNKLIPAIKYNLNTEGVFSILLPVERKQHLERIISDANFYLNEILLIQPNENLEIKYFIGIFSLQKVEVKTETIIIKEQGVYSERTNTLFKDFYLKL